MRIRAVVFVALVCLALPLLAQEQNFVMTIQFSGEKSEPISSFSWGVSPQPPVSGDASRAGRAGLSDFSFTRPMTQFSNTLFEACMGGKRFASVVMKVTGKKDKKETVYYEVKLTDVLVSGYRVSGTGGDATESISLTYAGIEQLISGR